ncbi:MAG: YceI family protein [Bacteroidota bacterium]
MRFLLVIGFLVVCRISVLAQIVVFVDASKELDQKFMEEYYDSMVEIARGLEIDIVKFDVKNGAPEEITVTPQIAFQNKFGRSFYVGRYAELSRFKVFLRTVARNPQTDKSNLKTEIMTYINGRSTTALPVKITELKGSYSGNKKEFQSKSLAAFYSGFKKFSLEAELDFKRTNRLFYLDVHPFVSEEGKLYLSYEIYSQFNCVVPVYSKLAEPFVAELTDYENAFEQLAEILENEVFRISETSTIGDGFTTVTETVKVATWESLGLALKGGESNVQSNSIDIENIGDNWLVMGEIDKLTPIVQFNFYAPLDNYAGEVKRLKGSLNWKENSLSGRFVVDTQDVTMGEETYDKNVHKKYIKVKRFPEASFAFEDFNWDRKDILIADAGARLISGTFSFMGREQEIEAATQIVPVMEKDNTVRLIITSEFNLNVFEHSKVNGPDGPKNARENMHFKLNFVMETSTQTFRN